METGQGSGGSLFEFPPNLGPFAFGISGPHATPFVPQKTTSALIHAAFQGGIATFDTAPSYGGGEAERRLGQALGQIDRDKVFVCTKAGVSEDKTREFSADAIIRSLDRSLERLQCEYVDALFLHGPGASELTDDLVQALCAEKKSGRIRYLGMAGRGQEIDAALALGVFDLLMAPVNAGLSTEEIQRLMAARQAGHGIFGIEVLAGASAGLRWPRSKADLWYNARALYRHKFGNPTGSAQKALFYALNGGLADVVMVSTTRPKHLKDALDVLDETARAT